jgi:WD40 repeat protein
VELWNGKTHKLIQTFDGADVAALSRDGELLATSAISIVETKSLKERCRFLWHREDANETIRRMHFSPSGSLLAITANGLDMLVFDTATCKQVAELEHAQDGDFSPDGSRLITANGKYFRVWQTSDWKLLASYPAGPDYTTGIAISPRGDSALIGGPNGAKLVRVSDGAVVAKFGEGWVSAVAFVRPDVVMTRDHDRLGFWSTDGLLRCEDRKLESGVLALAQDSSLLAVGALHQRDLLLWDGTRLREACHLTQ